MLPSVPPSTRRLALLLGGLAMFGPFSIDTIFPAFPVIGAQLGANAVAMQQTISVYLIAYALMSIVHGPLSDAIGRRRVILGGLIVFAAASAGCALARDLPTLLAFRALQGLSSGVGLIVGRAVIRDVLHGPDAQRLMSYVTMIFGIAPAIAPIIGGWILGWQRWPMIFWFLLAFALVLIVAVWRLLPETNPPSSRQKVSAAQLLRNYFGIFSNPRFQRLAAASAFNFSALFLYIASAPVFVLQILRLHGQHLTSTQFGWFFVPTIGGMMLGAFASGRAAGRLRGEQLVMLGFAASGLAMIYDLAYTQFSAGADIPWALLPLSLHAFGISLVFPVLTLWILDMYPHQRGAASSLQAFTSLVMNAVVAGVLSPLISSDPRLLALAASAMVATGFAFWRWEMRASKRAVAVSEADTAAC